MVQYSTEIPSSLLPAPSSSSLLLFSRQAGRGDASCRLCPTGWQGGDAPLSPVVDRLAGVSSPCPLTLSLLSLAGRGCGPYLTSFDGTTGALTLSPDTFGSAGAKALPVDFWEVGRGWSGVSVEHLISKGLSARACMIKIRYLARVVDSL